MYVRKIKFTDFLGNVREEEFRFNLTQADLLKMDLTTYGGIKNLLEKMTEKQDTPSLYGFFEEFLKASYGEISADGRNFEKGNEIWKKFETSNAYSNFIIQLVTNSDLALEFIDGVMPHIGREEEGDTTNITAIEDAKKKAEAHFKDRK